MTPSCRGLVRIVNCKALQPATAESQKRARAASPTRIASPRQLLHRKCSEDRSAMGLSPPPGSGSKQMRFVRRCSGIVSRTSICLTMKARLAIATSGKDLSSSGVQWSVPIPHVLRNGSRPRPKWEGEHAQPSARQAWRAWYKPCSSALSRCQTLAHPSARNCTDALVSNSGSHRSLGGPLFLTLALTRSITGRFDLHPRRSLQHHARDNFNAVKFNTSGPARQQIVMQNPGWVLVGDGDREQLARTFLQETNNNRTCLVPYNTSPPAVCPAHSP